MEARGRVLEARGHTASKLYIFGISIPNAQCMQNLGSIRPLGAILWPLSHIKRDFAVPLFYSWKYYFTGLYFTLFMI